MLSYYFYYLTMSIFEAKEFWTTQVGIDEEFDSNSIVIGNIDNESPGKDKLAVSSFKGYLRIFEPYFGDFKLENLLFEKYFNEPILQISLGTMVINSQEKQLLILTNKKFIVLQIYNLKGSPQTKICFEHKLPRNNFNFTLGKIGDKAYDVAFVQSVDGVISIIEQDTIVNSVEIYEMLLPGCLAYIDRKDYLVISNPAYEIECYSYNNLATSKGKKSDTKIFHNWIINLGELAKDIQVITNTLTKKQEILIMTETMLHLLSDNGQILFQKKLDYEAIAMRVYNIEDKNYQQNKQINIMCMISSHMDHILVYKGPSLSWACKVNETPVYLERAEFDGVKGLIVTLSDSGRLSLLYLGMEQVKNNKIIMPSKNYNPEKIQLETEKLTALIENFDKGIIAFPKDFLDVKVEVSENILYDENYDSESIYLTDVSGKIKRIQAKVDLVFDGKIAENVKINIITPYNIVCDEPIVNVGIVNGDQPYSKIVNFRVISAFYPTNFQIKVYATYEIKGARNLSDKGTKSTSIFFELPFNIFVRANQSKNINMLNKLTISTDKEKPIDVKLI